MSGAYGKTNHNFTIFVVTFGTRDQQAIFYQVYQKARHCFLFLFVLECAVFKHFAMLGKAMWFATVCTLAFAICGTANRDKGAADSKGITEDLEHRLMQETNFENHFSNTTNVSSTPLRKQSSRLYSALSKLTVIAALSSALTADAFTSPGVQGVRPFQKVSNTAFAPRLPPGEGESEPSTATRIFLSGSPSEGVEESASPVFDEKAFLRENSDRKKVGMVLITRDEFMKEQVDTVNSIQRKKASTGGKFGSKQDPTKGPFDDFLDGIFGPLLK